MEDLIKNIILLIILSCLIILMVGIVFYEYIPTRVKVSNPSKYEAEEVTTSTLASIKTEKENLFGNDDSDGTQSTIIHSYTLDEGDLKVYQQSSTYDPGRVDPFEDIEGTATGNGDTGNSNTNNNSNSNNNNDNSNSNNNSNTNTSNNNSNTSNNTSNNSNVSNELMNSINTNILKPVPDGTLLNSSTSK